MNRKRVIWSHVCNYSWYLFHHNCLYSVYHVLKIYFNEIKNVLVKNRWKNGSVKITHSDTLTLHAMGLKRQVTFLKNICMIDICQSSENMAMYAMILKIKFQNYELEDRNQASFIDWCNCIYLKFALCYSLTKIELSQLNTLHYFPEY